MHPLRPTRLTAVWCLFETEQVQCQAELVGSREELAKEKAENASLKVSLAEATAKVTSLEAAQATAKAAVEAAAKDFDVPDFDDIPDFDD